MHPNKTFFTCFYDKYGFTPSLLIIHRHVNGIDEREGDDEDEEDKFDYYL